MQNNSVNGFDFNEIMPLILLGGMAYLMFKGGNLSLPTGKSSEEKAREYEEKAKKYQELAETLKAIAAKENELKELKQALKSV